MSEIHSHWGDVAPIPDDLTLVQFFLDTHHFTRPARPRGIPWLVEDATGRQIDLEEVRTRTYGLANAMKIKYGIKEDDVVLLFSPNHVDYPVAIWATHRLGAIVSGANPAYTLPELIYQASETKAKLIITNSASYAIAVAAADKVGLARDRVVLFDQGASTSGSQQPTVQGLVRDGLAAPASFVERKLRPGEGKTKLAFYSFSSGTTGRPKAVAIPHFGPIANVIQMAQFYKVTEDYCAWEDRKFRPGDIAAAVLPFYHIYGLVVNLHFLLYTGMAIVVVPKFNYVEFLKSIVRHRVTHLLIVPPQVVLLCKHPETKNYDLSGIRTVMCGAAPLSPELNQQLIKVIPQAHIGQGYGMTETCTTVALTPVSQKHGTFGSAGHLMPGSVAKVVKPDGSLAKFGEPGELVVKGPGNALGYANNAEATKETFVDGWVHTGDEVIIKEDGDIFIVDRLKEIIKVRGFQVAPAELEGTLLNHADVADACVVGIPDEFSGEIPLAFVTLSANARERVERTPAEAAKIKKAIADHVAEHKVAYKHLAGGVEFVDVIPKNPSGKLLRRVLRDQAKELVARRKQQQQGAVAKL